MFHLVKRQNTYAIEKYCKLGKCENFSNLLKHYLSTALIICKQKYLFTTTNSTLNCEPDVGATF